MEARSFIRLGVTVNVLVDKLLTKKKNSNMSDMFDPRWFLGMLFLIALAFVAIGYMAGKEI